MKRPRLDGDEQDAFSRRARRLLHWRPGELRRIKRQANKRERREAEPELDFSDLLEDPEIREMLAERRRREAE